MAQPAFAIVAVAIVVRLLLHQLLHFTIASDLVFMYESVEFLKKRNVRPQNQNAIVDAIVSALVQ